jgi:hypothetical protein
MPTAVLPPLLLVLTGLPLDPLLPLTTPLLEPDDPEEATPPDPLPPVDPATPELLLPELLELPDPLPDPPELLPEVEHWHAPKPLPSGAHTWAPLAPLEHAHETDNPGAHTLLGEELGEEDDPHATTRNRRPHENRIRRWYAQRRPAGRASSRPPDAISPDAPSRGIVHAWEAATRP